METGVLREEEEKGRRRTESEFVLEADADEKKAEHVGEEVDDAGVKPDAGNEAPALPSVDDLLHIERAHLGEAG